MPDSMIIGCIGLVYFLAFSSLYVQLPGLIGDDGIAPVRLLDLSVPKSPEDFLQGIPSLLRFCRNFNLSEYHAAELLVLIGIVLSFLSLVVPQLEGTLSLLIQWVSFLSVVKVCPGVSDWKWASLLIEAGFLVFLLSLKLSRNSGSTSVIVRWLIRWLLFREAVSTGYTAMSNLRYSWYELGGMEYVFTSHISPTPLAWFLALMPRSFFRAFSVIVITMEIFVPFLFLVPFRGVQLFVFVMEFMFHCNLLLFGNDGIYHLLIIILTCAFLPPKQRNRRRWSASNLISIGTTMAIIGMVGYTIWWFFGLQNGLEGMHIIVPHKIFLAHSKNVLAYTIHAACLLFVLSVLLALVRSLKARGCMNKMLDFTGVVLVAILGGSLFVASLVPFSSLMNAGSVVALPRYAHEFAAALKPLHLANDYRFVNRKHEDLLLKQERKRTVLVLEGAMNENGPWKEFAYHHTPSDLMKMPSIIPGHFPVLDYEVAVSYGQSFEKSPVLASLVYRVLTNQKEVLPLIAPIGFPEGPKFIQIKKYSYEINRLVSDPQWWKRKLLNIYLPPTQATTPRLTQVLTKLGITGKRRERPVDANAVSMALDKLRALVGEPSNLNGFYLALLLVYLLNKILF